MHESNPPAVRTVSLTKRFGNSYALAGVDLEIPSDRTTAIVGPRGAGKSTLMSLIRGDLRQTAGRIEVLGLDPMRDATPLRWRIRDVSDQIDLPRWMTLRELCEAQKCSQRGWRADTVERLIDALRLPSRVRLGAVHDEVATLASLAMALGSEAELLLIDNALDGIDPERRAAAFIAIRHELAEVPRTVLCATDDHAVADGLGADTVTLDAGRVRSTRASRDHTRSALSPCPAS